MTLKIINRRTVKMIALVTMLVDHIGDRLTTVDPTLFDQVLILRAIGRIAFPLFAFQMALSFHKTNSLSKLVKHLFVLAVISEIPFDISENIWFDMNRQNVIWNFFFVGLALLIAEKWKQFDKQILLVILSLAFAVLMEYLNVDYGLSGFMMTMLFTLSISSTINALLPFSLYEFWWVKNSLFIASFLIYFYDDRSIRFGKWESLFYHSFYPLHLLLLYWLIT
ncbi:TraX family protein [Streptococcus fryi]